MELQRPLSDQDRTHLQIQAHRHALRLAGHLDAMPPADQESASYSVRQAAAVMETVAEHYNLVLAHQARQIRRLTWAAYLALTLALLALVV